MPSPYLLLLCLLGGCAKNTNVPSPAPPSPASPSPAHGADHGDGFEGDRSTQHRFKDPATYAEHWNDPARDDYQKPDEILAAMQIAPGATVMDLGAGTGYLVPRLSAAVGESGTVIAQDISPEMIEYLSLTKEKAGWTNVTVSQGAPDDPGLDAGSVDRIVTLNVWHHINDRPAFGRALYASLRPAGMVVIVDFLDEETEGFGPPMEMRLPAEQVVAELNEAGFQATIIEETMPRHYVVRGMKMPRP